MGEALVTLVKIILTVLISPVVYSCAVNFQDHLSHYPASYSEFFLWGIIGFVLVFLFVHQFRPVYQAGQTVMTGLFRFMTPMDRPIARAIPFYTALIVITFHICNRFWDTAPYLHYFMFFAGFAFAMHVLVLAQELQEEETSLLRPSYFLRMSIYFVFCALIVILLLDLVTWEFTIPKFCASVFEDARDMYLLAVARIL